MEATRSGRGRRCACSIRCPLQGVAALDPAKRQARVVFGGNNPASGTYNTNVVVRGLG
jgi:hypothetical protein